MWYTYILKCKDETLYTGITTDIKRRIDEHNSGGIKGSKYTRIRRPVVLAYSKKFKDRSSASKEESRIKALSKREKESMIAVK